MGFFYLTTEFFSLATAAVYSVLATNTSVDVFIITQSSFVSGRRFVQALRLDMVSNLAGMEKKVEAAQIQQKLRSKHLTKSEEIMQIFARSYNFDNCFCLIFN